MREVFKRFKLIKQYKLIPLFILILLTSVCALIISCEDFSLNDINFGGDLRAQIKKDLAVTYTFYEYQNTTSSHIDKVFITGKTVSESSFPKYTTDFYHCQMLRPIPFRSCFRPLTAPYSH